MRKARAISVWTYRERYCSSFSPAAIAALAQQQREQDRKKPRARGGRPKGGMGEQKLRFVESGVREEDADRIVAKAFGKPPEAVRRASKSARKKSPR
ncbi:hypothetical protein AB8Z38_11545 [Bradyrhizobium sp. LLZ17]|uniref:Uncharacterized protein n=1 Tax=Bradyrhizobium sp. LLZ17 TaxID=3239388 RepID=A0AB39XRR7_9BRAD